jgi:protoporphyrinogen oxidase
MDADVVVLGAGPAGLGAAWRAARAGHRVVVVERSQVPGGAAGSFVVGGQRVDHGSHRLHPSTDPAILQDLRELLGDELQTRRRNGRIRLEGRWIGFPLRAGDLVRRLPPSFVVAAARDAATSPLRRPRDDSFAEVLRAGLGPAICDRFYLPYARKIWGVAPQQLSGEQARRRVSAGSPAKLLRRIAGAARSGGQTFYYPAGGFGRKAAVRRGGAGPVPARRWGAGDHRQRGRHHRRPSLVDAAPASAGSHGQSHPAIGCPESGGRPALSLAAAGVPGPGSRPRHAL